MACLKSECSVCQRVKLLRAWGKGRRESAMYNRLYMIYLLTAIGLSPGGSSTVHIYTQTVHRTTQITTLEECGLCPLFASFTLAFALQLRKKHRKPSVRVRKTSEYSIHITKNTHTLQNLYTHTHTHVTKPTQTHTHTLQNSIKPPQYKLKQTQYEIYPNEIVTI